MGLARNWDLLWVQNIVRKYLLPWPVFTELTLVAVTNDLLRSEEEKEKSHHGVQVQWRKYYASHGMESAIFHIFYLWICVIIK